MVTFTFAQISLWLPSWMFKMATAQVSLKLFETRSVIITVIGSLPLSVN